MSSQSIQQKWDKRYAQMLPPSPPQPAEVLSSFAHLLPAQGEALDLACGYGGNALFLAEHGLNVTAWDISPVVLEHVSEYATQRSLSIECICSDAMQTPPALDSFDVIVVSHFLERQLFPHLIAALRPGGVIYYQTFTSEIASNSKPSNPRFLLSPAELIQHFKALRIHYYREDGALGNHLHGLRDQAYLIACRV